MFSTPYPWHVEESRLDNGLVQIDICHTSEKRDQLIATLFARDTIEADGTTYRNLNRTANARLMAAAPELLSILQHFLARAEVQAATYRHLAKSQDEIANNGLADEQERWNRIVRKIIKKAKGLEGIPKCL